MTGQIYEFDARPGGTYRMALTYRRDHPNAGKTSEDTDVVEGRFVDLVPNERVVQVVTFESDDPRFAGEMPMTWSISPMEGGAEVSTTVLDFARPWKISRALSNRDVCASVPPPVILERLEHGCLLRSSACALKYKRHR
jgi:uncharacterized protein YndB with AHSA1/START domain